MEENIEVKDVQRTEYLDKNGLDMLWAKVKENTHNQVEVEYNRAQAVEGDITNKLNNLKYIPYVSKNNMSSTELGDFVKYQLGATEFIISAQSGSNDARTEFRFGEVKFISISKDSAVSIDYKGITAGLDNNIKLTNTGIRKYINTNTPAGSATEAFSTDGGVIDTTAFALKSELDSYAKKTDIPEVDTSDFVIKTTRDIQTIKAPLTVTGNLQVNDIDNKPYAFLSATQGFGQLHLFDKATSARSYLEGGSLQINEGSDDGIRITCQGIRNLDNNANHVFATDGSIADLTQYAKKSEISAGGNVDDVQVNGVSVVENKVANIKPATKESLGVVKVGDGLNVTDGTISVDSTAIGAGNYIPYESIDDHINYKVYITKHNEGILFDSGNGSISISRGEMNIKSATRKLSFTSDFIWLQEISDDGNTETLLVELNESGLRLRGGDNNHVLTSYGSTIDIREYALKSVYDKKIAALEARIAVLENKHTETA